MSGDKIECPECHNTINADASSKHAVRHWGEKISLTARNNAELMKRAKFLKHPELIEKGGK